MNLGAQTVLAEKIQNRFISRKITADGDKGDAGCRNVRDGFGFYDVLG
jgi:hypothetical protein